MKINTFIYILVTLLLFNNLNAASYYLQGGTSLLAQSVSPQRMNDIALDNIKTSNSVNVSFGKQYQRFVWEIERDRYTSYFQKIDNNSEKFNTKNSRWTINVYTLIPFEKNKIINPYIGFGYGGIMNLSLIKDEYEGDFSMIYQLMTGVQLKINENFSFDIGYKFSLPILEDGSDLFDKCQKIKNYHMKSTNHFFNIGLRYFFN